jgi:hypothetical protein
MLNIGLGLGPGTSTPATASGPPHISLGTPADVGHNSQASGVGATMPITIAANLDAGTLVCVVSTSFSSANTSTAADSKGNTWTLQFNSGGSTRTCIWWSVLTTGLTTSDTITLTFSTATGEKNAVAASVTGVVSTSPVDQVPLQTNATSGAPSVTSAALAQAAEVAFAYAFITTGAADTYTEDATNGWTGLTPASLTSKLHVAWKITAATTAITYAPFDSASRAWTASMILFKENP